MAKKRPKKDANGFDLHRCSVELQGKHTEMKMKLKPAAEHNVSLPSETTKRNIVLLAKQSEFQFCFELLSQQAAEQST